MTPDGADEEAYLSKFRAALHRLKVAGASGIVADVRGHIAEAAADGRSLEQALSALGPPEGLARAYAVELALSSIPQNRWSFRALARLASLLIGASLVSLLLVPSLTFLAFTFLVTGAFSFVFALIELLIVDLPFIQNDHISPLQALGASIPIFAAGCLFVWVLWRYLRYLAASARKEIAHLRAAPVPLMRVIAFDSAFPVSSISWTPRGDARQTWSLPASSPPGRPVRAAEGEDPCRLERYPGH